MREVYREILPESYLLILAPERHTLGSVPLAQALFGAAHSGKPSVWIDCSELHQLSTHTCQVLLHYHQQFTKRGIQLILCHLEPAIEQELVDASPAQPPTIVPTLLDADTYCHAQRVSRYAHARTLPMSWLTHE
ncbi:STAS domain-containing protein [Hymenobacter sp. GOD-10R]|uniref:STAS domain-containing protein n=1 Tax=Hymenobacter sp. GOD-10R TaxID=3093922 RepID=UPI002D772D5F|nr:STAS domain-containing protein [Hymenobacter sp. GOD-10R]WRQ29072.1 STAS domain-containing protein [Hymenobacter sp. GOD-10R]